MCVSDTSCALPYSLLAYLYTLVVAVAIAVLRCNRTLAHLKCTIYPLLSVLGHLCCHNLRHLQKFV